MSTRPARQQLAETLRDIFREVAPELIVDWHSVADEIIAAAEEHYIIHYHVERPDS